MTDGDPAIPLWPDNPSGDDLLGFADIADPILEAVRREKLDPVAVGVFGDWGSGKSSVLEILAARLKDRGDVIVVFTRPGVRPGARREGDPDRGGLGGHRGAGQAGSDPLRSCQGSLRELAQAGEVVEGGHPDYQVGGHDVAALAREARRHFLVRGPGCG